MSSIIILAACLLQNEGTRLDIIAAQGAAHPKKCGVPKDFMIKSLYRKLEKIFSLHKQCKRVGCAAKITASELRKILSQVLISDGFTRIC